MKRALSIGVVALSLVGLSAQNSQAETINFDNLASGTVLTNQYPDIVSWVNPIGGSVYAQDRFSGPGNAVSVFGTGTAGFNGTYGAVDATFAVAQKTVSVDATEILNSADATGPTTFHAYMQVFNGNTLLDTIYATLVTVSGSIQTQTLSYTSSSSATDVTRVRLSAQHDPTGQSGTALFAEFDNLTFSTDATGGDNGGGNGGGGTPVPEPASLAMLSLGLATVFRKAKSA